MRDESPIFQTEEEGWSHWSWNPLPMHWAILEWSFSGPPGACDILCQSALSPALWIMPQIFSNSKSQESRKLSEDATKAKKKTDVSICSAQWHKRSNLSWSQSYEERHGKGSIWLTMQPADWKTLLFLQKPQTTLVCECEFPVHTNPFFLLYLWKTESMFLLLVKAYCHSKGYFVSPTGQLHISLWLKRGLNIEMVCTGISKPFISQRGAHFCKDSGCFTKSQDKLCKKTSAVNG